MTAPLPKPSREEQALREAGRTAIRPAIAWLLTLAFLALIVAVPLAQQVQDTRAWAAGRRDDPWPAAWSFLRRAPAALAAGARAGTGWTGRLLAANRALLREMRAFEDALEDDSAAGQAVRGPLQYGLSRWLGSGNEQTYCGTRGWLFYRPDLEYLAGRGFLDPAQMARRRLAVSEWLAVPHPDPRPAILAFHEALRRRGIRLVLLPVPPKSALLPHRFTSRLGADQAPLRNSSYEAFVASLQAAGVRVFDPTPALLEAQAALGLNSYLATDSHWRPELLPAVARALAAWIARETPLPPRPPAGYRRTEADITNRGDLAVMLRLPDWAAAYPPEPARLQPVLAAAGGDWVPDPAADVLVLGDSFCNIYSLEAMGWGANAGLIEQLSLELQRPLDALVVNDHGAWATRERLAHELARGRDRLAGKRLVVWEFAMRELAAGDWKPIPLELRRAAPARFVVPPAGAAWPVRGRVQAVAPAPRPGTVPYKDHIVALRLVDLEGAPGAPPDSQALVYLYSLRDNARAPAARLRPGDAVALRLRPWSDVAETLDGINRAELPDDDLALAEPCWGDLEP